MKVIRMLGAWLVMILIVGSFLGGVWYLGEKTDAELKADAQQVPHAQIAWIVPDNVARIERGDFETLSEAMEPGLKELSSRYKILNITLVSIHDDYPYGVIVVVEPKPANK